MIGTRLKRLMENHLRLTATNKVLKGQNKTLLDHAVVSKITPVSPNLAIV